MNNILQSLHNITNTWQPEHNAADVSIAGQAIGPNTSLLGNRAQCRLTITIAESNSVLERLIVGIEAESLQIDCDAVAG